MEVSQLEIIHQGFNSTVEEAFDLIKATNDSNLTKKQVFSIYEIAFLRIFTGLESFLEKTFIAYMTGESIHDYQPEIYLKKIDRNHALSILTGTKNYPDWTNINDVYKIAELYFVNGEPFSLPLKEIEKYFNEIKKVRNAIVHISEHAQDKFKRLVKSKLPSYHSDVSPGEFLSELHRKKPMTTFIQHYTSFLQTAASKIIKE